MNDLQKAATETCNRQGQEAHAGATEWKLSKPDGKQTLKGPHSVNVKQLYIKQFP